MRQRDVASVIDIIEAALLAQSFVAETDREAFDENLMMTFRGVSWPACVTS